MEDKNSVGGVKFGFSKPAETANNKTEEQKSSPVEGTSIQPKVAEIDDEEQEYTEEKTITISLVKSYSLYRKANDKVLPKRKDYIGGSVSSSRILASNKEEVEAYFPNIIGLSPNNPEFVNRVKLYLNNIRIPVDELGKQFNISFHYYHKKDYIRIKKEEEKIENTYQKADRSSIKKIKDALKEKISRINVLESTKHKYGYPLNVDDYLMYRHCLLYDNIAKDISLINADPSIRFYFKDDAKEEEKLKKYRQEINRAKANYVTCLADDKLFDAIYIQYCSMNNLPVLASLAEDRMNREIKLDKFSTEEPMKFNTLFNNKDIKLMADIELLISRGELIRSQYNQNISTPEGEFIGANLKETIAWFKNPLHLEAVNILMNKLKNN